MCSGSEAGSYLRLIDFGYHSTQGLRVIKQKKKGLFKSQLHGGVFKSEGGDRAAGVEARQLASGVGCKV